MADKKITELTAVTDPADADILPIVDLAGNETKKVTVANLFKNSRVAVSAQSVPIAGSCYFDTATFIFYIYTGTAWKSIQLI